MRDRKSDTAHRTAAEAKLGRKLRPDEIVHHRDTNKANNTPSNLEPTTRSAHSAHHAKAVTRHTAKLTKALTMQQRREKLY